MNTAKNSEDHSVFVSPNCPTGARILLALQNVDVPWYIQQQVDIHPDSNWRQPQRDPNWYDPLAAPVISMENTHGAAVVDPSVVQWKNLTLDRLDFTQYVQIEPEGQYPCTCRRKRHDLNTLFDVCR